MKTISDALTIRRRVYGAFEMAQTAATPEERRAWLTFVLVGAGPTGVELAGQLREVATITLRHEFRTLEPEDARVLLFDGGSAPLAVFGPKLSQKAASSLDKLGVEQHMGSIVTHVDQGGVLVRDHAARKPATTPTPCCGRPASKRHPWPLRWPPPPGPRATGAGASWSRRT